MHSENCTPQETKDTGPLPCVTRLLGPRCCRGTPLKSPAQKGSERGDRAGGPPNQRPLRGPFQESPTEQVGQGVGGDMGKAVSGGRCGNPSPDCVMGTGPGETRPTASELSLEMPQQPQVRKVGPHPPLPQGRKYSPVQLNAHDSFHRVHTSWSLGAQMPPCWGQGEVQLAYSWAPRLAVRSLSFLLHRMGGCRNNTACSKF